MPSVDQRLVLNKQLKTTCSFSTTSERKNEFAEFNETPSDAPGICNSETTLSRYIQNGFGFRLRKTMSFGYV